MNLRARTAHRAVVTTARRTLRVDLGVKNVRVLQIGACVEGAGVSAQRVARSWFHNCALCADPADFGDFSS